MAVENDILVYLSDDSLQATAAAFAGCKASLVYLSDDSLQATARPRSLDSLGSVYLSDDSLQATAFGGGGPPCQ